MESNGIHANHASLVYNNISWDNSRMIIHQEQVLTMNQALVRNFVTGVFFKAVIFQMVSWARIGGSREALEGAPRVGEGGFSQEE